MPLFRVDLSTLADVSTVIEVETDTAELARANAIKVAQEGSVAWKYQGAYGDEINATSVTEVRR